jgi:hypothetical protein
MASPRKTGAALNIRHPTCALFVLNGTGMNFIFCNIGFHARNFLVLLELAGRCHPETTASCQNRKFVPDRSISLKGDRQLAKGASPILVKIVYGTRASTAYR